MFRRKVFAVTSALLVLVGVAATSGLASAQSSNNSIGGNALRISPVRQDLTIKPGSSKTVDVFVENLTSKPTDLQGIVNDFTASKDESGTPRILLDKDAYAPNHGLKRYVSSIDNFTLKPKEQKNIKVTITIPKDAAGGGYFGAVRFAPSSTNSNKNVSLSASVGSLLLVTVPGNITEQVSVAGFNVGKGDKAGTFFTNSKGLNSFIRFQNSGNVQEYPFGKITLKKSGKVLQTVEINNTDPRGAVLPDSIRKFVSSLDGKANSFGKYTIEGNFGYGSNGQLLSAKTTFYIVPVPYLIGALVIVLLILLAIFIPRLMKKHDRKLLRKAANRPKARR
jgi:hypothetical protein